MQTVVDFLVGLVAALAAAALAHLGVDLERRPSEPQEIRRIADCPQPSHELTASEQRDC